MHVDGRSLSVLILKDCRMQWKAFLVLVMFEILTLQQTNKAPRIPTVLVDEAYWTSVINFRALAAHGVVGDEDLALFRFAENAEQAWERLQVSSAINGGSATPVT